MGINTTHTERINPTQQEITNITTRWKVIKNIFLQLRERLFDITHAFITLTLAINSVAAERSARGARPLTTLHILCPVRALRPQNRT